MGEIHRAPQDGSFDSDNTSTGTVRVVRDDDRATMYLDAPGMSDDDRATHWLTADVEDFSDVEEMR